MTVVPIRGGDNRERHGEQGHVMVEGESRVMQPQAQEHLGPLESGGSKEGSSPRVSGESFWEDMLAFWGTASEDSLGSHHLNGQRFLCSPISPIEAR